LIALARALLPSLLFGLGWMSSRPVGDYLVPQGLVLMGLGLLYLAVAFGTCSDRQFVVLTRRELAAFFYSPIAYLVFLGLMMIGWLMYWNLLAQIVNAGSEGMWEPIVRDYVIGFIPVICVIFIVPVLTMRLLSEEQRTGTLEVLLTAPLKESSVVLSKFLAALILYLLAW